MAIVCSVPVDRGGPEGGGGEKGERRRGLVLICEQEIRELYYCLLTDRFSLTMILVDC